MFNNFVNDCYLLKKKKKKEKKKKQILNHLQALVDLPQKTVFHTSRLIFEIKSSNHTH